MTSIEHKLRLRAALRDKLTAVLKEVEDGVGNGIINTAIDAAIWLQRIEAPYRPIQKLKEDIFTDTEEEMVTEETSDATSFIDRVVKEMAELRYGTRDLPRGEPHVLPHLTRPPSSETTATKTKLPTIELTKFDEERPNWTRF